MIEDVFPENDITVELLGVFKLTRKDFSLKSASKRNYDSLSIRTEGRGHFKTETGSLTVSKGDLLYIPKTASYSQQTAGETLIAIHFINYSFNKEKHIAKLTLYNREYVEQRIQKMYDVWKEKSRAIATNVAQCCMNYWEYATDRCMKGKSMRTVRILI